MNVLNKKLLRDLSRSKGQAIAVAAVVLCGISLYISMAGTHRNLLLTKDSYYARYRMADFFISLERAPRTALERIGDLPGVLRVQGRIVKDVNLDLPGVREPRFGRIIAMPAEDADVINDIALMKGRYFSRATASEVIVSDGFASANQLEPGDTIEAVINAKKHRLRVVGTALSPEYVYAIRGVAEIAPEKGRFGILWAPRDFVEMAYGMSEAVNDVVGLVEPGTDLDIVLDEAEDLLDGYGVFATLKREDQMSNQYLTSEIEGLEGTARVTPAIFLGVAAMVLTVLLNRMVRQERTQIGLLKAYGYSRWTVSLHYVKFALVMGVAGTLGGIVVGQLFARGMIHMYVEFFQFPVLQTRFYPDIVLTGFAISAVFSVAGALGAVRRVLGTQPAEAMRPETPRYGSRTALEHAGFVWRRLSFTWKMIVRNVSRYRFRAGLTVAGVMLASSLLVVGFFTMDAMHYLIDFQFFQLQKEDVRISFEAERGKRALYDVQRLEHVRYAEPLLEYPFEVRAGWRKKDIGVTGIQRGSRLRGLTSVDGRPVELPETGLVLSGRLAEDLGVQAGDTVILKSLKGLVEKEAPVTVSKVVRQYLGLGAYMDLHALSRFLDESFAMNAALATTHPGDDEALAIELRDVPVVSGVQVKRQSYRNVQQTLADSMQIMNSVLVLFSGLIAFAIIYNSTIVSLSERQRELASLRVMGFTKAEVGRILYHENALLSAAGLALGLPVGALLSRLLVEAFATDIYQLPFHIDTVTFVNTVVLTVVFVLMANVVAHRRVRRLDLIEVLKSRE